jgi:hypothetical protein
MTPDRSAVLVTSWHTNSIVRFNLTGGSREPVAWSGAANHGLEGPFGLAIGACVALRTDRALRVIVSRINYTGDRIYANPGHSRAVAGGRHLCS